MVFIINPDGIVVVGCLTLYPHIVLYILKMSPDSQPQSSSS